MQSKYPHTPDGGEVTRCPRPHRFSRYGLAGAPHVDAASVCRTVGDGFGWWVCVTAGWVVSGLVVGGWRAVFWLFALDEGDD